MTGIKLNLGCGRRKQPGWVNVDKAAECAPDMVVDLERFPWPWPEDSVAEVLFSHALEHLGAAPDVYIGIFKELYRVCRHGAIVTIVAPHPRHDHFLNDPTHVRAITPQGLELFSLARNREWRDQGRANTPLALYAGVDFDLASVAMTPDEPWRSRLQKGEITPADLSQAARQFNNVVVEMTVVLQAVKGAK
jgi:hypothetical protein